MVKGAVVVIVMEIPRWLVSFNQLFPTVVISNAESTVVTVSEYTELVFCLFVALGTNQLAVQAGCLAQLV